MHALLGENGAGKSTLMNVLYGLYKPDEGEILLNGEPVVLKSAKDAIDRGIGMVHQHFMLIPVMTVAENIVLANEPTHAGIMLDYKAANQRVRELAAQFKFEVDPDALIADITVGQQQRVEILKALYRKADVLILDEPTAVLTPQEALELFEILRNLKAERDVDHLHHAQAERGARDRGPDQRAPPRQEDRHDPARGRDRGEPRAADGRPRGRVPGREERRRSPGERAARGARPARVRRPRASRRCAASRSR